ncbi:MAG TPA: hypothetical protein VMU04_20840 [Candidatus Acidoferrum sp.]|nr:hypothetical protein [Candidatus Acidoferrum sp.]
MKTNTAARRVFRNRVRAGMVAVVLLVSVELCMLCRLPSGCQRVSPAANEAPPISDLLAAQ